VRLARQGDSSAYELLFKRNEKFCYLLVNRYANIDNIDDLLMVAKYGMVKAYKSFNEDKGSKFLSYAKTCITNELLMHHRKIARYKGVGYLEHEIITSKDGESLTLLETLDSGEDILQDICNNDTIQVLMKCVGKLSPKERGVIECRFFRGMTQKEVAKELGVSQSCVSRYEKRILSRLKTLLNKEGIYEAI
jgi:RNA polymerase sporulation-specific sigma factor